MTVAYRLKASLKHDGIYMAFNGVMTIMLSLALYMANQKSPSITVSAITVVLMSYVINIASMSVQAMTYNITTEMIHVFRQLVSTTVDLAITYSLYGLTNVPVATPKGVLLIGLLNVLSLFSYTSMLRESYVFYETQTETIGRDIAPTVLISGMVSLCLLTLTQPVDGNDRTIRIGIIAMMILLGSVGQQTDWIDPLKYKADIGSEGGLSTGNIAIIVSMGIFWSVLVVFVFWNMLIYTAEKRVKLSMQQQKQE